jgi:hypothetical protein
MTQPDMAAHIGALVGALEEAASTLRVIQNYDLKALVGAASKKDLRRLLPKLKALQKWLSTLEEHAKGAL